MVKQSLIGVVTVTYNSEKVVEEFLDCVLKQQTNFILYVIDNASSDETVSMLAQRANPKIVVMRNANNVGVAEGNNIGIRAALDAGCTSVLLINNDTVFVDGLFATLESAMSSHNCDMVVPKIMYFDDPKTIWCAGGYFSRLRGTGLHYGIDREDRGQFDTSRQVEYSPTCCMLIRPSVFARIGLMDPKFFVYYDDTDFCYRAKRAGMVLSYVSSAKLLHKVNSLTGKESDFSIRYGVRNHTYFYLKHYSWLSLLFYLPAFQAHLAARFLIRSRGFRAYCLAQRAFWEGVSVAASWDGAKPCSV
jgi:GT2 family glycosyltransferase